MVVHEWLEKGAKEGLYHREPRSGAGLPWRSAQHSCHCRHAHCSAYHEGMDGRQKERERETKYLISDPLAFCSPKEAIGFHGFD